MGECFEFMRPGKTAKGQASKFLTRRCDGETIQAILLRDTSTLDRQLLLERIKSWTSVKEFCVDPGQSRAYVSHNWVFNISGANNEMSIDHEQWALSHEPRGMSHEPWDMSHEPLAIINRSINKFFDVILLMYPSSFQSFCFVLLLGFKVSCIQSF